MLSPIISEIFEKTNSVSGSTRAPSGWVSPRATLLASEREENIKGGGGVSIKT